MVLCLFCLPAVVGCGGGKVDSTEYEHVYTVRGRVLQLPGGAAGGSFVAHHEPIPEYISISGDRGMQAMAMPFAVHDAAVLDGVAVGDIVEIVFGETHRPKVRQGVISVKVLPADSKLTFEKESAELD